MASILRRLSTSNKSPEDEKTRRRSSAASTNLDNRTLGARDYKLAQEPEESRSRRSSVASTLVDLNADDTTLDNTTSNTGGDGRIYGARDYKLIARKLSKE